MAHNIIAAILAERARQDAKWGPQNHPDVDRVLTDRPGQTAANGVVWPGGCDATRMAEEYGIPTANRARHACDTAAKYNQCTWVHIFVEELAELVEAATLAQQGQGPEEAVDKELVQVLAVGLAWAEARARRRGEPAAPPPGPCLTALTRAALTEAPTELVDAAETAAWELYGALGGIFVGTPGGCEDDALDALSRLRVALGRVAACDPSPKTPTDDHALFDVTPADLAAEIARLRAERDAAIARAERVEVAHSSLQRAAQEHLATAEALDGARVIAQGTRTEDWLAADRRCREAADACSAVAERLRTLTGEG